MSNWGATTTTVPTSFTSTQHDGGEEVSHPVQCAAPSTSPGGVTAGTDHNDHGNGTTAEVVEDAHTTFGPTRDVPNQSGSGVLCGEEEERRQLMESAVRTLLREIGEEPEREGLQRTPQRAAKALLEMTSGYGTTAAEVVGQGVFTEKTASTATTRRVGANATAAGGIVLVENIETVTLSADDLEPWMVICHVGYIPRDGIILGLSKLARIAELYARRLQQPEQLASQIADGLSQCARSKDVVCLVDVRSTASADVRRHVVAAKRGRFELGDPSQLWEEFLYTLSKDYSQELLDAHSVDRAVGDVNSETCAKRMRGQNHGAQTAGQFVSIVDSLGAHEGQVVGACVLSSDLAVTEIEEPIGVQVWPTENRQHQSGYSSQTAPRRVKLGPSRSVARVASAFEQLLTAAGLAEPVPSGMDRNSPIESANGYPQKMAGNTSNGHASSFNGHALSEFDSELPRPQQLQLVSHTSMMYAQRFLHSTRGIVQEPDAVHIQATSTRSSGRNVTPSLREMRLNIDGTSIEVVEVTLPPISFSSQCEHHLLPFHGRVYGRLVLRRGNTELPWASICSTWQGLVELFSCRLQVQERLTAEVIQAMRLSRCLEGCTVEGAMAAVQAAHSCMAARGICKPNATTITSAALGVYADVEHRSLRHRVLRSLQVPSFTWKSEHG